MIRAMPAARSGFFNVSRADRAAPHGKLFPECKKAGIAWQVGANAGQAARAKAPKLVLSQGGSTISSINRHGAKKWVII
jgi:hypothetical protein